MKKEDPVLKAQARLAALRAEEQELKNALKGMGAKIREDVKPKSLLRSAVSGVLHDKGKLTDTATAALSLGAGLVAGNLMRKQQRLSLVGKTAGLAISLLTGIIASRKSSKKSEKP
jgi:hypothetical protein